MASVLGLLLPPWLQTELAAFLVALQSSPAGLAINVLALALLGAAALRWAAALLGFVYAYFLRPGRNLRKYGEWAVVTGATDGIGRAYCEHLARQGERRRRSVAVAHQLGLLDSFALPLPAQ